MPDDQSTPADPTGAPLPWWQRPTPPTPDSGDPARPRRVLPPDLDPRGRAGSRGRRGDGPPRGDGSTGGRTHGGRWRRVVGYTAATMSVLVLLVSAVGYGLLSYSTGRIKRIDVFAGLTNRPAKAPSDAVNYLVAGSDKREGLTAAQLARLQVGAATAANGAGQRSDTVMLVHISADRSRAIVVSLPRDTYVQIPAHTDSNGQRVPATYNKLNAAFSFGGPSLLVATVEAATGVHIDHYVEVNFAGFVGMVDALGGVNICVPKPIKDAKAHLDLPAGMHHFDGVDSLKYVRARYFDGLGDLGRMQRQQGFIGAMLHKAMSAGVLLNPVKLTDFVNAALDSVTTDPGLSRGDVLTLAQQLRNIAAKQVSFLTVPLSDVNYTPPAEPGIGSTVLWDPTLSKQLFYDINHDLPLTPTPKPSASATLLAQVPPSHVRVAVFNATTTTGLGARAANDFAAAGFQVAGPAGNAPVQDLTTTVIRYDPRWNVSVTALHAALPHATLQQVTGLGGTFQVYVGSDYSGLSKVSVATPTPSPSAALQARTAAQETGACTPG